MCDTQEPGWAFPRYVIRLHPVVQSRTFVQKILFFRRILNFSSHGINAIWTEIFSTSGEVTNRVRAS